MALLGQRATGKSALLKQPDCSCCDVCNFSHHRDFKGCRDVSPHRQNLASVTVMVLAMHEAIPGKAAVLDALKVQITSGDVSVCSHHRDAKGCRDVPPHMFMDIPGMWRLLP